MNHVDPNPKPALSEQEKERRARKERDLERREAEVIKAGGVHVYVTRWREGRAYVQVCAHSFTSLKSGIYFALNAHMRV
jgi:hypothetical protein